MILTEVAMLLAIWLVMALVELAPERFEGRYIPDGFSWQRPATVACGYCGQPIASGRRAVYFVGRRYRFALSWWPRQQRLTIRLVPRSGFYFASETSK